MIASHKFILLSLFLSVTYGALDGAQVILDVGEFDKNGQSSLNNPGGFPEGYSIDGALQPELIFYTGRTYTFNTTSVSASHPIYISYDFGGENVLEIPQTQYEPSGSTSNGFTYSRNNSAAGLALGWSPTVSTKQLGEGRDYYYQCRYHQRMGYRILVLPLPLCLSWTDFTTDTGAGLIGPAAWQVLNSTGISSYTTRVSNLTKLQQMATAYTNFLGSVVFGCDGDPTVSWTGSRNLTQLHTGLGIAMNDLNLWLQSLATTELWQFYCDGSYSCKQALAPYFRQLCNQASCKNSICDVYSNIATSFDTWVVTGATENRAWLASVVSSFLTFVSTSPDQTPGGLRALFNATGVFANSTRFTANMISYLGSKLGCSNPSFPSYAGNSMLSVHANLNISRALWKAHMVALLRAFDDANVNPLDQDQIERVLNQDLGVVCTQADCQNNVAETFIIRSGSKAGHPWQNIGYLQAGFVVDTVLGKELNLAAGSTYVFHNNADCTHPVFISSDINGSTPLGDPLGIVTLGVSSPGIFSTCNGAELTFTPVASQIGVQLYYQCPYHDSMGYKINVCLSIGANGECIMPTTPGAPTTRRPATTKPVEDAATSALPVYMLVVVLVALLMSL